jgi:hypothetical protein
MLAEILPHCYPRRQDSLRRGFGHRRAYTPMTPDEQMRILCERIATEQDSQEFTELVQQLNDLLEAEGCRLVENKEDLK